MAKSPELVALLTELRAGRVPEAKLYTVLHTFGNECFLDAQPDVEAFLKSSNPELRYIALNVLAIHWMRSEHRVTCEKFAINDAESDNRRMGVAGLGALLEGTKDKQALGLLLSVFQNEGEDWDVRDAAYRSILYVLGRPACEQPSATRKLDYTKDVDWRTIHKAEEIAHDRVV